MNNLALEIIDESISEGFTVNNDSTAEWALKKLAEEKAETQRMINVCETMINQYKLRIAEAEKSHESKTSFLRSQLQQYFATVPHKVTKTQETYKLPSGTLKYKVGGLEYIRDEEKLIEWIKENGGTELYIKTKESVNWADLKKTISVSGENAVDVDGEIIPGVTVQKKPDTFEIEI